MINFTERALKDLSRLDRSIQQRIQKFLRDRVAMKHNVRQLGKPLVGAKKGLWRYRVGDYRLLCHIQDEKVTVLVVFIKHRAKAYV